MPRPASNLAVAFIGHLKYLEKTRAKIEALAARGAVVRRDAEQVHVGLYLDAITSFEHLIEDLFIGLLVGRIRCASQVIAPRVSFQSDRVARDIVFGGRNYVDWFPYGNAEQKARAFFRKGLPFTGLDRTDKTQLEQLLIVRNAIAHKSDHSKRMFEDKVLSSLTLMPRERTPAGFLRSVFRIAPTQTRYEDLVATMAAVASKLCT